MGMGWQEDDCDVFPMSYSGRYLRPCKVLESNNRTCTGIAQITLETTIASNSDMARGKLIPFRRIENVRPGTRKLFKSFCPACGMFVSAGTNLKVVRIAESAHSCPQPLAVGNRVA